jgi:hypothetical protein
MTNLINNIAGKESEKHRRNKIIFDELIKYLST